MVKVCNDERSVMKSGRYEAQSDDNAMVSVCLCLFDVFARASVVFQTTSIMIATLIFSSAGPMWAWERCRISPPRFLAECRKRRPNQVSFVLLYFALFAFCVYLVRYVYFPVLFCLSVSVK